MAWASGTGDGDPTCRRLGSGRGEGTGHCSVRGPLCRARGTGGAWGGAWLPGARGGGRRAGPAGEPGAERWAPPGRGSSSVTPGEAASGGVSSVSGRQTHRHLLGVVGTGVSGRRASAQGTLCHSWEAEPRAPPRRRGPTSESVLGGRAQARP